MPTTILTSATLAVGKEASFDFFQRRMGLTQCAALHLDSPFDYSAQAELVTCAGMPDPASGRESYERACVELIQVFVAVKIAPWLQSRQLNLLSQADGTPRTRMLELFQSNPRAVLLGTDSFWQGVDVPGDALQLVIIAKLPFSVPDRPLTEARLQEIRDEGGEPFRDYQVPEAVLKLKQGFGRLIRTSRDSGRVVILDPRVHTKPYGTFFLDSLPRCRVTEIDFAAL